MPTRRQSSLDGAAARGAVAVERSVARALRARRAVVALESSVLSQGLPRPVNREAATLMAEAVRSRGAVPAITAVLAGRLCAGVDSAGLESLLMSDGIGKVSTRDLAVAVARGSNGATTVAAAIAIAHRAGISVFATGGIGGVHRGDAHDESADLLELSRTPVVTVCAGAKAILDLPATAERCESLGIQIVGYRTDSLPGFYTTTTGIPVTVRCDAASEVAAIFRAQRAIGAPSALLVVQPPPPHAALPAPVVEKAIDRALVEADRAGVRGSAVTPFLLAAVEKETGGRSLRANLALLESNAALAAEIAAELARTPSRRPKKNR